MVPGYRSAIIAVLCSLALLASAAIPGQAARKKRVKKKKPVAVVKVFEGAVLTKSPHGSLKQISAKSLPLTLFSGDTLVTHDGRVEIRYLTNQSTLRIL